MILYNVYNVVQHVFHTIIDGIFYVIILYCFSGNTLVGNSLKYM